jgi:hypothetical protein
MRKTPTMSVNIITPQWVHDHIGNPTSHDFDEYLEAVWVGTVATEGGYARYQELKEDFAARLAAICAPYGVDPATAQFSKSSPGDTSTLISFRLPDDATPSAALRPHPYVGAPAYLPDRDTPEGKDLSDQIRALQDSEISRTVDLEHAVDPTIVTQLFREEDGRTFLMWPRVHQDPDAVRPVLTLRCDPEGEFDMFNPDPIRWTRIPVDVFRDALAMGAD